MAPINYPLSFAVWGAPGSFPHSLLSTSKKHLSNACVAALLVDLHRDHGGIAVGSAQKPDQ